MVEPDEPFSVYQDITSQLPVVGSGSFDAAPFPEDQSEITED